MSISGTHFRNNFGYRRNDFGIGHSINKNLRVSGGGFLDNQGGHGARVGLQYKLRKK